MAEMRQVPEAMRRVDFAAWLHRVADAVASGDSMEGSLEYLLDYEDEAPEAMRPAVMVRAGVRFGNRMGQGGMTMIGEWVEVPDAGEAAMAKSVDEFHEREPDGG